MEPGLTHRELEELLGVYALDAVEAEEAEAVELHLLECPRCRAEVADHRTAASYLAATGERAPAEVWDRIAAALEEPPPPLELVPRSTAERRRAVSMRVGVAVAGIAAMLAAILGVKVIDQGHKIDRLAQPSARSGLLQAAGAASLDPRAQHVQLTSAQGALSAEVVLLPSGDGYVVRSSLPALPADRTYQLWALVGTGRMSAGVLGTRPGIAAFKVGPGVWGFAITDERSGGAVTTANAPVVVGRVQTT